MMDFPEFIVRITFYLIPCYSKGLAKKIHRKFSLEISHKIGYGKIQAKSIKKKYQW